MVEFQHSHLKSEEALKRTEFHQNIIWVVDATRRKTDASQFKQAKYDGIRHNTKDGKRCIGPINPDFRPLRGKILGAIPRPRSNRAVIGTVVEVGVDQWGAGFGTAAAGRGYRAQLSYGAMPMMLPRTRRHAGPPAALRT